MIIRLMHQAKLIDIIKRFIIILNININIKNFLKQLLRRRHIVYLLNHTHFLFYRCLMVVFTF